MSYLLGVQIDFIEILLGELIDSYPSCIIQFSATNLSFDVKLIGCKSDLYRRIPYIVALKNKHEACAALLNPSSPEPLTWPAPLKFITELDAEAKALLENALIEANKDREKLILEKTAVSQISLSHCDFGLESDDFEVTSLMRNNFIKNYSASTAPFVCLGFQIF